MFEWFQSGNRPYDGKFVMNTKILKYPTQLMPYTPYQFLNCPDFSKYIDYDEAFNNFVLRDLKTSEILVKIPNSSLNLRGGESSEKLIRRFKWIDNRYFKFITLGKVERLIDTYNNFEEVEYNIIADIDV